MSSLLMFFFTQTGRICKEGCHNMASAPTCQPIPVPWPYRVAFYAASAFYLEVIWTAIWDCFHGGNVKLRGYSSIWSMFVYATAFVVVEQSYRKLKPMGVGYVARGLINTVFAFIIELVAGLILKPFAANSWDYSEQFTYNYQGLIALEYAPLWYFGVMTAELQVVWISNRVRFKVDK